MFETNYDPSPVSRNEKIKINEEGGNDRYQKPLKTKLNAIPNP